MNPPFLKAIANEVLISVNTFTTYVDTTIPAGSVEVCSYNHVLQANLLRSGYQFQLVQRTNVSDKIMASSAQFSIAASPTAEARNATSERSPIMPVAIAVSVVLVVLLVAGVVWFCWFRKRRRQIRAQSSTRPKSKSFVSLESRRHVSISPICEAKPDIEERSADRGIEQHGSTPGQSPAVRKSSLPLPLPPPPPVPAENTAELPIFVTPRSSRFVHKSSSHPRAPAELDICPPSPRPKSANGEHPSEMKAQAAPPTRRSRLSLQQVLHLRKVSELEGNTQLLSDPQEHPTKTHSRIEDQLPDILSTHPARRSKRLSLHHLLHYRKYAELEGSSATLAQVSNAVSTTDECSLHPASRRSHRISLHRLLHSKKQTELEENTDILPVYSHTDSDQKSHFQSPPLPLKDMDRKDPFPASLHTTRAMTPVELEAIEPKGLFATSLQRARSWKSRNMGIADGEASSSSPTAGKDLNTSDRVDQDHDNNSEEVPITLMKCTTNASTMASIQKSPDAVEFLDLNSTDSEGSQEEVGLGFDGATMGASNFATPLGSPPVEEAGVDPFLTAAIISAAVESFESSPTGPEYERADEADHAEGVEKEFPLIHEMDATDSAIKRQSKRQSSQTMQKRRPDFISFKKQMTEAERRAKMIAKRRRSRRRLTPKSF
jgi:hypothetical protein